MFVLQSWGLPALLEACGAGAALEVWPAGNPQGPWEEQLWPLLPQLDRAVLDPLLLRCQQSCSCARCLTSMKSWQEFISQNPLPFFLVTWVLVQLLQLVNYLSCSEMQGVDKVYVSKMIHRKGTLCFQLLPRVPQQLEMFLFSSFLALLLVCVKFLHRGAGESCTIFRKWIVRKLVLDKNSGFHFRQWK